MNDQVRTELLNSLGKSIGFFTDSTIDAMKELGHDIATSYLLSVKTTDNGVLLHDLPGKYTRSGLGIKSISTTALNET
ncbi:MAG: hypothetical protein ACFB15_03170, partial [Cyclobacteriaceae bacterium]